MIAISLFDSILSDDLTANRSHRIVAQVVSAALNELAQIETLDDSLAPEDASQFDRRTATLLRDEYQRSAHDAESLVERIDSFQLHGGVVADAESLRRAHGKTRARLSISIDEMEQSLRAIAERRLVPTEKVRRALRLRVH